MCYVFFLKKYSHVIKFIIIFSILCFNLLSARRLYFECVIGNKIFRLFMSRQHYKSKSRHSLMWAILLLVLKCVNGIRFTIEPNTGYFIDSDNRVRLFRGFNSVEKEEPWYNPSLMKPEIQELFKKMGFNVVRLGIMWSGVQPKGPQDINREYLRHLSKIISELGNAQILTLLDMHQDNLWNSYYGIPKWVKEMGSKPLHPFPWPMSSISPDAWICGYFSLSTSQGFQDIYDNYNGTTDALIHFWKIVVDTFKSNPHVLGYELLNEPWCGNVYKDTSLLFPGMAGSRNLEPLYNKLVREIWKIQGDALIFWEPTTWAYLIRRAPSSPLLNSFLVMMAREIPFLYLVNLLKDFCSMKDGDLSFNKSPLKSPGKSSIPDNLFGFGFRNVPGGRRYLNQTVISWHHYCPVSKDVRKEAERFCSDYFISSTFESIRSQSKKLGGAGSLMTEFGLCNPDVNFPKTADSVECDAIMNMADKRFESWIYWDTADFLERFFNEDGSLRLGSIKVFSRVYPRITNGQPKSLFFDIYTSVFRYEYYPFSNHLETEIFVPEFHYPNFSYSVKTSSDLTFRIKDDDPSIVFVYYIGREQQNIASYIVITKIRP